MCLYKTLIRPVLTYGAEKWTQTVAMESHLNVFERKLLWKIYGPVFDTDLWRCQTNAELYSRGLKGDPKLLGVTGWKAKGSQGPLQAVELATQ